MFIRDEDVIPRGLLAGMMFRDELFDVFGVLVLWCPTDLFTLNPYNPIKLNRHAD
jgi:hypothetical protein